MSEILTHDQHVALVNDLMISAMEDIDLGRNEAGVATLARQSLLVAQFAALRAENERLREALEEIAAGQHGEYCGDANARLTMGGKAECDSGCPVTIARAALAPAPKEVPGE